MAIASKLLWLVLFIMPGGFVLAPLIYVAVRSWTKHVQPKIEPALQRLSQAPQAPTGALVDESSSRAPA